MEDIIIIGAGPVGLFAVFQAGMCGINSLVIDTLPVIGGQCKALYSEKYIYDIPAYPKVKAGELVDKLMEQNQPFKPKFLLNTTIKDIQILPEAVQVTTTDHQIIESKALIIASGGGNFEPNRPPLPGIEEFENKSIYYSIANPALFKDKTIAIAGGGDSAADWAITLSEIAKKTYFIHRRDNLRCSPLSTQKLYTLKQEEKVELVIPYQLSNLIGSNGQLSQIELTHITNQTLKKHISVDFLLPFFGLKMDLNYINSWGITTLKHHIKVESSTFKTNLPRVYAIGDAVTYPGKLKLILTGFAEAAVACHSISHELFSKKSLNFQYSTNLAHLFEPLS